MTNYILASSDKDPLSLAAKDRRFFVIGNSVVVYGPAGSGKTLLSYTLKTFFGCKYVYEEWDGITEVKDGTLCLTNLEPLYQTKYPHIHLDEIERLEREND